MKKEELQQKRERKKCKDYFFLSPKDRFLSTWDTFMLLIISYACFSSAYYVAFDFPRDNLLLFNLEHVVFAFFSMDIIFNFMRVPESMDGPTGKRDHLTIFKTYFKSGWFFFDLIATFPFYLI